MSRPLAAYVRVCRELVPNVNHEKLVQSESTRTQSLVVSYNGEVVGGVTFRMVLVDPIKSHGAPRILPERQLVLDILLLAVQTGNHRRGLGSRLVACVKSIALAHACAHRAARLLTTVQADNEATGFWSNRGFNEGPEAGRIVQNLFRWRPHENTILEKNVFILFATLRVQFGIFS